MALRHAARNPGKWAASAWPGGAVEVDWSHPLAAALMGAWMPAGGALRDVSGGGLDIPPTGSPVLGAGAGGPEAQDGNSNSYLLSGIPARMKVTDAVSLYYKGRIVAAGVSLTLNPMIFGCAYNSAVPPFIPYSRTRN